MPDAVRTTFTAAEFARALSRAKRLVLRKLANVAPSAELFIRGQLAKLWPLTALPAIWQAELIATSQRRGFRSVTHFLLAAPEPWVSPLPVAELNDRSLQRAAKLKRALGSTLAALNDLSISDAELQTRARADYRAAFGRDISAKQLQRLIERTVKRGGGAEDWNRIELYVDENCGRKAETPQITRTRAEHRDIAELVRSFARPGPATDAEKVLLWQSVFDRFEDLQAEGCGAKDARRSLVDFLTAHAPFLAANRESLQALFKYKHARWKAGGCLPSALADRRADANAARRLSLSEEDKLTVLTFATKHDGNVALGWREACRRGALSLELRDRYIENPRRKSYVPRAIAKNVKHDAAMLRDLERGPRTAQLNGAYIERDPTTFASGDWMQGDDCTLPVYFHELTSAGVRLVRGQFLALIDCRSGYILSFALISPDVDRGSTYNAWNIRNLITQAHDTYGLPRKGFAFENGSWRAKLLVGSSAPWDETEQGLREFGVRFVHSRLPRAKVIERILGLLQTYCEEELGYVGRNEMLDKFERVQRQKQLVLSGKEAPEKFFLSRAEWIDRLTEICDRYNGEKQGGKYLRDPQTGDSLSPREGYQRFFGNEPVVQLPDSARYLLANEKLRLTVGSNGISFTRRGESFTYKNERTGALRGQRVEAFFNYESPELLGVKDPNSGDAFAVRRATIVPGMDAPREMLKAAHQENAAHESYRRALYRSIAPRFSEHFMTRPHFRPVMVDRATADTAQQLREDSERELAVASRERSRIKKAAAAATRLGVRMPMAAQSDDSVEAIQDFARLSEKAKHLRGDDSDDEHGFNMSAASGTVAKAASHPARKTLGAQRDYNLHVEAGLAEQSEGGLRRQYWRLWRTIDGAGNGVSRHALTHKALGSVKKVTKMTAQELSKVISLFAAVAAGGNEANDGGSQ